jgi:hypothetical protein
VKFFFIDMLLMAAVLSIQAVRTVKLALKEYNSSLSMCGPKGFIVWLLVMGQEARGNPSKKPAPDYFL